MGTRGLFGFRKDGVDKVNYCQFDSYPEGLGNSVVMLLKHVQPEKLERWFDKIIVVDTDKKPTDEQKNHCKEMGWVNTGVSSQSLDDWYCITRELQDPESWETACRADAEIYVAKDQIEFIKDSLFCEYVYIYDLDTKQLEFYTGFQKMRQTVTETSQIRTVIILANWRV